MEGLSTNGPGAASPGGISPHILTGVYVHIPWCAVRCPYCAFAVDARRVRPERAYTDAVLQQWEIERSFFPTHPDSVYFGGGTPSQADPRELGRILGALEPAANAEITAEVNPGRLDAGRLVELAAIGVNRVSLGVQSFQPEIARRLGRAHSAKEAAQVYALAKTLGFRSISLDLMFAVPGQTLADLDLDLDRLVADPPDHVSLYGLTIEPGTPFSRAGYETAVHNDDADDLWRRMYDRATERLAGVGIDCYEVSNFARTGHRSVHNEHYWRARSWAGLGASAHGFRPDGARTRTRPEVDAYVADPSPFVERVPPREMAAELIGSTLRHVDGLDILQLRARTGLTLAVPEILLRHGTLTRVSNSLRIRKGDLPLVDYVAARLCEGLTFADPEIFAGMCFPTAPQSPILLSRCERPMPDPNDRDPDDLRKVEGVDDEDPSLNAHLALDIDPDLLEAALAAVDRAGKKPAKSARPMHDVDIEVEGPAVTPPPRPEPAARTEAEAARRQALAEERILQLNGRIREQAERLARADEELRRLVEARNTAEAQLTELRNAARGQSEDFDRFRQRARKEKDEAEKVGEERILRQFLESANNVERAWRHAQADSDQLLAGLQMIVDQFRATLRRSGVERIPTQPGVPFDPEVHEAVLHVPDATHPPGSVLDEASPGWRLRGRLFQAARVTVAAPLVVASVPIQPSEPVAALAPPPESDPRSDPFEFPEPTVHSDQPVTLSGAVAEGVALSAPEAPLADLPAATDLPDAEKPTPDTQE